MIECGLPHYGFRNHSGPVFQRQDFLSALGMCMTWVTNPHEFSFELNVSYDVSFSNLWLCCFQMLWCLDFIIFSVRGEIISIRADMQSCCQVGNPHIRQTSWAICPNDWSLSDHFTVFEVCKILFPLNHSDTDPQVHLLSQHLAFMWPSYCNCHISVCLSVAWKTRFSPVVDVVPVTRFCLRCEMMTLV